VQRYKRKVLEYFADVYSGKFTAQILSAFSKHLTKSYIQEIGWQQELAPCCGIGWATARWPAGPTSAEALVSSQPPQTMGAHRHTLGSGRTVESIAVAANADGTLDALQMVTNDAASGVRHVEMLTRCSRKPTTLARRLVARRCGEPEFVGQRCNAAVDGAPYGGLTLYGLWHLNGKTVSVFAGGLDCGDFHRHQRRGVRALRRRRLGRHRLRPVHGGVRVDGLALTQIVVASPTTDGQIVRPHCRRSGARNGPALGKTRQSYVRGQVINTAGCRSARRFAKLDPQYVQERGGPALTARQHLRPASTGRARRRQQL
jgi:hypothetical protein